VRALAQGNQEIRREVNAFHGLGHSLKRLNIFAIALVGHHPMLPLSIFISLAHHRNRSKLGQKVKEEEENLGSYGFRDNNVLEHFLSHKLSLLTQIEALYISLLACREVANRTSHSSRGSIQAEPFTHIIH